MRCCEYKRKTAETEIRVELNLDGGGFYEIDTGIGFFDHMMQTFTRHGLFDLNLFTIGDLHVDQHHTVEDIGLALGEAFRQALGEKRGINRCGSCAFPMDETLAMVALDLSGRPYLVLNAPLKHSQIGDFETGLVHDFFQGFVTTLGATLHIQVPYGRSEHHQVEAIFKAVARALKSACEIDSRVGDRVPSTKEVL